jgi:hypothetical protein
MISFVTPTALPIEAATTMGVSVKDGNDAIGKFGTGLKYAIAGILRLNGRVEVDIDGDLFRFTARETSIRGKDFRIVHCNEQPCGFTTELGKHWEPWQLFRELASNALDEGGRLALGNAPASEGRTVIRIDCREVEESEVNESVFRRESTCLIESTMGAQVYAGPCQHYYYKGIRAGSFPSIAPVTVDVSSGSLSEDRLLDLAVVESELTWAFRSSVRIDESLLLSVMRESEPHDFWVRHTNAYGWRNAELPSHLIGFLADRPKFIRHPGLRSAFDMYMKKGGRARWQEVPMTPRHSALLVIGERIADAVGIDPIPREKTHFTRDLGDSQLAVTCMDTRHVWFSTKIAAMGDDEFLAGYLEEAIHAMTGFSDCTREFQNMLLSLLVSTQREAIRAAA